MSWYGGWRPYVPVAKRRAKAASYAATLAKREKRALAPVELTGRKITTTFWGQAWCDNLEHYSDFANRLPRGRTYVRNGSVIDLQIERGTVKALVSGSEIYHVTIAIRTLAKPCWSRIKRDCSQAVDSLIDLLQGRFDQGVMQRLTQREGGLFPHPKEIEMVCTCPDWATLCKHVAATLYGVGARLDTAPELLFTLRDVDHLELVSQAVAAENLDRALGADRDEALAGRDLGELFGIEIETGETHAGNGAPPASTASRTATRRKRPRVSPTPVKAAGQTRRKPAAEPRAAKPGKAKPQKGAAKKSVRKPVSLGAAKRKRASAPATQKRKKAR